MRTWTLSVQVVFGRAPPSSTRFLVIGLTLRAPSSPTAGTRQAETAVIEKFQQKLVRLVSLLNAMILGELEGADRDVKNATRWELIDVSGLDRQALVHLSRSKCKPETVFQWLQNEIVDNVSTGVLGIPAPLLTRAFQEFANGHAL